MRRISALLALLTLAACSPGEAPPSAESGNDPGPASDAAPTSTGTGADAETPGNPPPFRDATAGSGLDFHHFNGMTGEMYFSEMVGPGAALFDLEGDGDLDLFIVQGSPLRDGDDPARSIRPPRHPLPLVDRLYRNELQESGDLRFTDITESSRLDSRGYGMGVAAGDIDNDGYPDLYITNFGDNALWRNRGDGTFEDVTERSGTGEARWSVAATFFDYDRDGWLDLFVGNYVEYSIGSHKRCRAATGAIDYCGPHSYATETDRLFRNRGDGTFEDVTSRLGLDRASGGTLGVVEADFDLDGALDLYVANDGVANHLWMPRAGAFSDEALLRGAALNRDGHAEAGMGVDAGDVDNDGDEDIFLTHLTQETNTLYLNLGNATFDDATSVRGLGAPSWEGTGFGTGFLDFDLDGWLDLVVLNGAVKVIEEQRGEDHPLHQPNQLYRNRGEGHFEEIDGGDAFAPSAVSRGVAIGDIDNDGDPDLVILNNAGPARLLLGDAADRSNFLGLRLLGAEGGPAARRDMIGAWVELRRPDGPTLYRRARTGGGYVSAHDPRLRFGLGPGEATPADPTSLHVTWPDGARERFEVTAINRYLTLRQGDGQAVAGDSP